MKQRISIDCLKLDWYTDRKQDGFAMFFVIFELLSTKKTTTTNKQHLGSLPFAGAHYLEGATSMYSWQGVFTDQFIFRTVSAEFWISFKSHKPVSKTYRPKNDNFCLLRTLRLPFWYLILHAFIDLAEVSFSRENCPKLCLKINRSVKTPWHRPRMEVNCSLQVMGSCHLLELAAWPDQFSCK